MRVAPRYYANAKCRVFKGVRVPYASNSVRITFGGSLFDVESWSVGFRARSTTPESNSSLIAGIAGMSGDIASAIGSIWTASSLKGNSQATLDFVKVAALDVDGHYADGSDADLTALPTGTGGAGGGSAFAPQLSTVATLLTDAHRGHASKGRIYLPATDESTLTGTGELSSAYAIEVRSSVVDFINAINGVLSDAFSANMKIAVMSPLGAGLSRTVTQVKAGRVIDTQRRRRRQLDEAYTDPADVDL